MGIEDIENIIEEYGSVIYRFCIKITGNKEDGEDLYQQTFLKAVELKSKIDKNKNPRSFLVSVAIKVWKNSIRKNDRRNYIAPRLNVDDYTSLDIKDSKTNTEDEVINKEIEDELNVVIRNLDDKFKIPIIMHYTVEMSIDEIARALKIPKGTVKSRLYKARAIIKKELEEMGYERL